MGEGIALYYLHSGGIGRYKKDYDKRFSFGIVLFQGKANSDMWSDQALYNNFCKMVRVSSSLKNSEIRLRDAIISSSLVLSKNS